MAEKTRPLSKSKLPKPFIWTDHLNVAVTKRANGHAKAGAFLARMVNSMPYGAMDFLFHLSKLGFYGEEILYGFEHYCRSDIDMFKACVELEDKGLFNSVLDYKAHEALKALKGHD